MTFEFQQALQSALNQMRVEFQDAIREYKADQKNPSKKAIYLTYKSVIERLDSLV